MDVTRPIGRPKRRDIKIMITLEEEIKVYTTKMRENFRMIELGEEGS